LRAREVATVGVATEICTPIATITDKIATKKLQTKLTSVLVSSVPWGIALAVRDNVRVTTAFDAQ
jgi:hypothetical protein